VILIENGKRVVPRTAYLKGFRRLGSLGGEARRSLRRKKICRVGLHSGKDVSCGKVVLRCEREEVTLEKKRPSPRSTALFNEG